MIRSRIIKFALVFVATVTLFQNCSRSFQAIEGIESSHDWIGQNLLNELNQKTKIAPHVDYFGYYASAYNADYIDEVKDHTNVIFAAHYDDTQLVQILNRTEQNGLKAIVLIQYYFYAEGGGIFRSDALSRWQKIATKVKPFFERGVILSFYIDEPELYARISNTLDKLPVELPLIAKTVRDSFPGAKLQMTSSFFDVKENMYLPAEFDYFGFDCYDSFESCGDAPGTYYTRKSIPEMYSIIESKVAKLNEDGKFRRIFLFPPTSYLSNKGKTATDAIAIFDKYINFAKEKPLVLGLLSFLWATHRENLDVYVGARDDQNLRSYLTQFGKTYVVSESLPQETGATGGDLNTTPKTPQILNSGLGCDDNLCIWAIAKELGTTFRVTLVNPADRTSKVVVMQPQIYRKDFSGSDAISFRIPGEYLNVYLRNGVLVLVENIYSDRSTSANFQLNAPSGSNQSEEIIVEPSKVVPDVTGQGLGCDDNMCIWFTSRNLTTSFQVVLRDPQDVSSRFKVAPSTLYRRVVNGVETVSFPIPSDVRGLYQSRGVDVLIENIYPSGNMSTSYRLSPPKGSSQNGEIKVEPSKVIPEVIGQGLGCDDNMCIWFTSRNLTQSYQVTLQDPQSGASYRVSSATLYRRMMSGGDTVSFSIPAEVRSIYQNRGVRVVIENIYSSGNTIASYNVVAPKVNSPDSGVVVAPLKITPEVTGKGLGCDDNMCIWFTSRNLSQSYQVTLEDPQTGKSIAVVSGGALYRRMMNGAETVSFPIPSEARGVFLSRGLKVLIENIYSGDNVGASFQISQ